jgi:hypothetical protein
MFGTKESRAQAREQRQARLEAAKLTRQLLRAQRQQWLQEHPQEGRVNATRGLNGWPQVNLGQTAYGSIAGAHAELWNADAHKGWTATRLISNATLGVATGGLMATGRKSKGAAAINVTYADGMVQTFDVKPQALAQANRYVAAFNAYASSLSQ